MDRCGALDIFNVFCLFVLFFIFLSFYSPHCFYCFLHVFLFLSFFCGVFYKVKNNKKIKHLSFSFFFHLKKKERKRPRPTLKTLKIIKIIKIIKTMRRIKRIGCQPKVLPPIFVFPPLKSRLGLQNEFPFSYKGMGVESSGSLRQFETPGFYQYRKGKL